MSAIVLLMLAVCVGIPLAYVWRLVRLNEPTLASWGLVASEATVIVALVLLVGRWDMAGYYTRIVLMAGFAVALIWSLLRHLTRPWRLGTGSLRGRWPSLLSLLLFGAALAYVAYGMMPPERVRALALPLANGRFMVGQGGGSFLLNRHAGHKAQRFAVDITALNGFGVRADGLNPGDLGLYAIFGASVVSPCDGRVVEASDGLPDLKPPQRDRGNPAGNHVVIDCGGFDVELAHLRRGSVGVARGDSLAIGDRVGEVGNSGNTTEPHLHIHAVDRRTGMGLPMLFDGRAPVRNRLFVD